MSDPSTPPQQRIVPNANSPELLTHMLEMIARGVRSARGLREALGIDLRTVRYYGQAATWLGFLHDDERPVLSPLGLEYVYAGAARDLVYARAVASQPLMFELLQFGPEGPTNAQVEAAIHRMAPGLAASTVSRRVSAVRGLLAPALRAHAAMADSGDAQLDLPLSQTPKIEPPPPLSQLAGRSFSPDIYRYLLCYLLDHGELTLGHIRGLLDRTGAKDVPIGSYVDLALTRQDAVRVDERLVVTAGAIARRELTASTASIILSDAGWRTHLDEVREQIATAKGPLRLGGPYRRWNERLFGHSLRSRTLESDLRRVLRDRSLRSFPRTSDVEANVPPRPQQSFLDCWQMPSLIIALPPSLAQLWEGVAAVNRRLRNARHRADAVGTPTLAYRPVAVNGGLIHPGEPLPRSVPDQRTLRQRLLTNSPYVALVMALLLVHRRHPSAGGLEYTSGTWKVRRGRTDLGRLFDVLDAFAGHRGWLASRRTHGGLDEALFVSLLERVGLLVSLEGRAVLDDAFFEQLASEEEEQVIFAQLDPLSRSLGEFLATLQSRAGRIPR